MKSPIRRLVAMSFAVLSLHAVNSAVNTAIAAEAAGTAKSTPRLIF